MLEQNQDRRKRIRVELGQLAATPAALEALAAANVSPIEFIARHQRGDWGEVCEADKDENDLSLREGFRLLSEYTLPETGAKVWIITEADRSVTTLLLPEEY